MTQVIDLEIGAEEPELAAAKGRPMIAIPVPALAAPTVLMGRKGWLIGWSLRDASGGANTQQVKNATTTTGAALAPALTDVGGSTTFVTGFDVNLGTPAAAAAASVQLNGIAGTPSWEIVDTAAGGGQLSVRFPSPISGAAITLNVPAVGGVAAANSATLYGYTTPGAGFVLDLFDGGDVTGELLASFGVGAGGFNNQSLGADGIPIRQGLFAQVVSGSARGALWVRI